MSHFSRCLLAGKRFQPTNQPPRYGHFDAVRVIAISCHQVASASGVTARVPWNDRAGWGDVRLREVFRGLLTS